MKTVNLIYRLSPEGRKAALLAGEPATTDVTRQVDVDLAPYADVIRVDTRGNAEIYSPDYIDTFDATPSVDECVDAIRAAKVELAERKAAEIAKNEAETAERVAQVAAAEAAFLADPAARACGLYLTLPRPRFQYAGIDVPFDCGNAAHAEAIARHDADCEAVEAREAAKAAARTDWIRGFLSRWSTEMLARFDAGLLPDSELEAAVRDWAFSPLNPAAAFAKLQPEDLKCNGWPGGHGDPINTRFHSFPADSATAGEFATLEKLRAAVAAPARLEQAEVTLRTHVAECECGTKATRTGILVVANCGPFGVRMEFAAE